MILALLIIKMIGRFGQPIAIIYILQAKKNPPLKAGMEQFIQVILMNFMNMILIQVV